MARAAVLIFVTLITIASVRLHAQSMTDRETSYLRGQVHTVQVEFAELDPQTNDWGPFKQQPPRVFDGNGQLEGRVFEEGVLSTTFDESGRRTTVTRWPPRVQRPPGMEYGVGFDPSDPRADVLTRYDTADRPVEIVFRNGQQQSLNRIELTYDANGRLSRERVFNGDVIRASPGTQEQAAGNTTPLSAQELAEFAAVMRAMMPDGVFIQRKLGAARVRVR